MNFLEKIISGPAKGEADQAYLDRIVVDAKKVLESVEIDEMLRKMEAGIATEAPITIGGAIITSDRLKADLAEHASEIERVRKINRAIIAGIAAIVVGASVSVAAGGAPTSAIIPALISIVQKVLGGQASADPAIVDDTASCAGGSCATTSCSGGGCK
jgi:hypothetical protein